MVFISEKVKGRRVLITGGSQNIGEELAYQFSKLGAQVVVTARRESELKKVWFFGSICWKYLVDLNIIFSIF